MVPTPFGFFKVKQEKLLAHTPQFGEAELGKAPEALDAVDVVLAPGKLVFVVENAVVFVAAQKQPVVAEPAVGVHGGHGKHLALDDRLQRCTGTVYNDAREDLAAAL